MYDNLLVLDEVPVADGARTTAYAKNLGLGWFQGCGDCGPLEGLYGPHTTPEQDGAAWYDPDNPTTAGFAGVHILDVAGMWDSTYTAPVVESLKHGGAVQTGRRGTRSMVFTALLIGTDEAAVFAGLGWLKSVLQHGNVCQPTPPCQGHTLRVLTACPPNATKEDLAVLSRSMYDVSLVDGPKILSQRVIGGGSSCDGRGGGAFMEVEWTLVAANPSFYMPPLKMSERLNFSTYQRIKALKDTTTPVHTTTYQDVKDAGGGATGSYTALSKYLWTMQDLLSIGPAPPAGPGNPPPPPPPASPLPSGFYDPACPAPPTFPVSQPGLLACRALYSGAWKRRVYAVATHSIPDWATLLPRLTITDASAAHSDVRVRFTKVGLDPDTQYGSEFYITFLPRGGVMALDGVRDRLTLTYQGRTESAAHLVVSDRRGSPFRWPEIRCGDQWIVTVDTPSAENNTGLAVEIELVGMDV